MSPEFFFTLESQTTHTKWPILNLMQKLQCAVPSRYQCLHRPMILPNLCKKFLKHINSCYINFETFHVEKYPIMRVNKSKKERSESFPGPMHKPVFQRASPVPASRRPIPGLPAPCRDDSSSRNGTKQNKTVLSGGVVGPNGCVTSLNPRIAEGGLWCPPALWGQAGRS